MAQDLMRRIVFIALFGGGLFLNACATTTMHSIGQSPDFDKSRVHKVLIVSLAPRADIRGLAEDEFVRQWSRHGVHAVASRRVLPGDATLDKAGVAPFAKAQGFDSVMVTRLMKRQNVKAQTPYSTTPNLTEDIKVVIVSPEYGPYDVVVLRTNLYDVASERLLWSGMSETVVLYEVPQLVRPMVKTVFKALYDGGHTPQSSRGIR